jgi:hypothetical protein
MKTYLALIFILIANPVSADWTKVAESENKLEIYIDLQTVHKDGNNRKVWQLTNYPTPQFANGQELLSIRARYEFDCKHDKRRSLTATAFAELFAGGKSIGTEDVIGDWKDIPPDSVVWTTMKRVCKAPAR